MVKKKQKKFYVYFLVSLHVVVIKEPCFLDSKKQTKLCMITDGKHKAQMRYSADIVVPDEFMLKKAGIVWSGKDNKKTTLYFF